ncbi:serine/threonine-protein kinase [Noviherbaspirillum autotrophicum]|uniref:serine/threonine-protein kinase n=1 Tax=Noviherbaspirillum autotrophicum TaxID=709839 RepID=UPI000693D9F7|nr:serine/threonine-protein kinase [Noviherbaspirillum autotrophicum]
MMNNDKDKTVVRSRRVPPSSAGNQPEEHSVNVLPVGTRLGEFEILELIGEGGFGIVYLAYDHSLERHVALKEYMPTGLATRTTRMAVTVRSQHNADTFTAGLKSFVNEARMLAQFDSPSLVKVYRFWEANGTAYMVMPFYEGITLKKALKEHRITPTENWIRMLLADLFDAIDTIHRVQCFHRDIAPDNILLLKDGRPLLLDFGAARRVIGDLTQGPTVILKPGFAPIEQYADIAGLRQGAWTDIYALAAVVYYLMTGRAPPPAVARIVKDEMVPAREVGKGRYTKPFLAVIDKALSVKPEQRYQSIAELRRALDIMESVPRSLPRTGTHWSNTDVPTVPIGGARQDGRPQEGADERPVAQPDRDWQRARGMRHADDGARRGKPAWLALGLLLLAGISAGGYWGMQYWNAPHQPALTDSHNAPAADSSGTSSGASSASGAAPEEASPDREVAAAPPAREQTPPAAPQQASPPASAPATPPPVIATTEPAPKPSAPADVAPATPPPAQDSDKRHEAPTPAREAPSPAERNARTQSEDDLWRVASASDRNDAYEFYLNRYPKGRYAAVAKQKLKRKTSRTEEKHPALAMNTPREAAAPAPQASAPPSPAAPQTSGSSGSGSEEQPRAPAATPSTSSSAAGSPAAGPAPAVQSPSPAAPAEPAPSTANVAPASSPPASADDLSWQTAAVGDKITDYQAYLDRYPNGRHATAASDKLASLKRQLEPSPALPKQPAPAERSESRMTEEDRAPASDHTVLRMAGQTMTGRFTADPKTGVVSGTGRIVWSNGDRFEGTLVNGIKQGKGLFVWANGQRYKGEWADDMPNGRGTIYYANGNRYDGEVKDGRPHGQGVTRFKGGDVYAGTWVRGKSQGQGRYTWANGSYWEGEFRDDRRTENGKMVFADAAANARTSSGDGQKTGSAAAGNGQD